MSRTVAGKHVHQFFVAAHNRILHRICYKKDKSVYS